MKDLIRAVTSQEELSPCQIVQAVAALTDEAESEECRAEFLSVLHRRGETPAEIAAFVDALLERAVRPPMGKAIPNHPTLDVCGTGGDKAGFFNVSTAVMFVVAAAGARVVKHGNRGITSRSGGADVLAALGVRLDIPPSAVGEVVAEAGCVFLFAPNYHPAFKAIAPVRKKLAEQGEASIFNLLGPLLNPCLPEYQFAGVFHERLVGIYAEVFPRIGRLGGWIVHGRLPDGRPLDELTAVGTNRIAEIQDGTSREYEMQPSSLGLSPDIPLETFSGGSAEENAAFLLALLQGQDRGPRSELVALNAAGALMACRLATNLPEAYQTALALLHTGAAFEPLEKLRAIKI